MKTIARLGFVAAAALVAAVFFSGCTTARRAAVKRPGHFYEMTVVQSSGPVDLSAKEMTQLRESAISFVEAQGVLVSGAYYVQVKFKPTDGDAEGGWIVVKLVERNVSEYEMAAGSEPNAWPYYYDPFYYRYGYASFGNYPFDVFDYAYDGGYVPPRFHPREHRPSPNDHDHHDDDNNHRHDANDHHHDGGSDVARNHDGHGNYHHPAGSDSGNDHRSPEPRHWDRGGSTTTSYSPPSSSGGGGGSSYSAPSPAPSNPEPAHDDPIGRNSTPEAAR